MPEPRPWVLLRGLGREARHWGSLPGLLAAATGSRIYTPDLPGNGRLWRQPSASSIAGQLSQLRQQLVTTLRHGPVQVLAISLGGMVALEWATHHPEEVARLALVNTSLAGLAPPWQRLRWQRYPALLRLLWQDTAMREHGILQITSNLPTRRQAVLHDWQQWQQACPVSASNLLRQLAAAARYRPPTAWPRCPVLLLNSQQDQLVHPRCSQRLAQASGWPLRLHPYAGHDLALDDPLWLAQQVAGWARHETEPALAIAPGEYAAPPGAR